MKLITKIACRTIGTVGIGTALYDTYCLSKQYAKNGGEKESSAYIQKIYANSRTIESVSHSSNDIRKVTFDTMMQNPLPHIWGTIKGGFKGMIYALSDNLFTVACGAIAICSKNGLLAKTGCAGVFGGLIYKVLQDGLGFGKHTPVD